MFGFWLVINIYMHSCFPPMDLNTVKFYYANPCFLPCDFYGCFFFLLSMSVLKAHKSLCYYVLFFHVQTINKALIEWITSLLIFFKGLIKENLLFFIFYFLGQNIIAMMVNSKSFLVRWVYLEHSFWLFVWW